MQRTMRLTPELAARVAERAGAVEAGRPAPARLTPRDRRRSSDGDRRASFEQTHGRRHLGLRLRLADLEPEMRFCREADIVGARLASPVLPRLGSLVQGIPGSSRTHAGARPRWPVPRRCLPVARWGRAGQPPGAHAPRSAHHPYPLPRTLDQDNHRRRSAARRHVRHRPGDPWLCRAPFARGGGRCACYRDGPVGQHGGVPPEYRCSP